MNDDCELKPRDLVWLGDGPQPGDLDSAWVVVETNGDRVLLWSPRTKAAQYRRLEEIACVREPESYAEGEMSWRPWKR